MVTKLSPLAPNVPIVDKDGNPTPYFQRMLDIWLKEKAVAEGDLETVITDVDTLETTVANLELDDLADVDVSTTPPDDGQTIVWDEANSEWVPGDASGGGGPWQLDTLWEHSVSGNTTTVLSGDLTGYNEVRIVFEGSTATSSGARAVRVSVDGGSSYLSTSGDYKSVEPTGAVTSETCIFCHSTASASSRGGVVDIQLYPSGTVKAFKTPNRSFSAAGYVSGSLLPINKIAVTNLTVAGAAAGDFSSGKIWILKR